MTEEEKDKFFEEFLKQALAPAVILLEKEADHLRVDINEFNDVVKKILDKMIEKATAIGKASHFEALPGSVRGEATCLMVSGLNSALKLDHPYAVSVLMITGSSQTAIASIRRAALPGRHDIISRDFIPLVYVNTVEDFANNEIQKIEMKFLNSLEDFPEN